MKRQKSADDLAARLTVGATTALQVIAPVAEQPTNTKQTSKKRETVPVYLRLPGDLHSFLDDLAIERTKETGRGVSVQQIIIEILERSK